MPRITAPEEMTELKELDYGYQFTIMKASLEPYMNLKVVFLAIYRTGKQFDRRVKYLFLEHVEQENPSGKGVAKA